LLPGCQPGQARDRRSAKRPREADAESAHCRTRAMEADGQPERPEESAHRVRDGPVVKARETPDGAVLVSADNFTRAESDLYFSKIVSDGGFGRLTHIRELTPLDKQLVVRSNRDTLYSAGVFDLDTGPVTISLPHPGGRFMSMQVITEDQHVPAVFYGQGEHTLTRDDIGTQYGMVA